MPTTVLTPPNVLTVADFSGGVDGVDGRGQTWQVTFDGVWHDGDTFTFQLITPSQTFDFGVGRVSNVVPVSAITLYNRVHFVAGKRWYGSDNGDSTAWEQQAPGAFVINITNQSAQPEDLLTLAPFQGRMAIFSRRTTQIWVINADPTLITQQQVLANVGTVSPQAAQSLGDSDIPFPSDSGIRSLRVQTINLNGYISDIGAPIDSVIQNLIIGQTSSQLSGVCSTVEPTVFRYMVYFPTNETLYVLSYFPASKIVAWSTYLPYMGNGVIRFNVESFRTFNSVVYFRATTTHGTVLPGGSTTFIGTYGTFDGSQLFMYDSTQAVVTFPFLDLKKAATLKTATQIDYVFEGQWDIYGSMDYNGVSNGAPLQQITSNVNPPTMAGSSSQTVASFQTGSADWTDEGYHIQLKAIRSDPTYPSKYAKLSELVFHYEPGDEK